MARRGSLFIRDEEDVEKRKSFAATVRRLTIGAFSPKDNNQNVRGFTLKPMPGKQSSSIIDVFMLRKNGLRYLSEKAASYKSKVYKFPLREPSNIICDGEAILDSCCNDEKVIKEPVFGNAKINLSLFGKYVPCAFTNDFVHARRKAFIIGLVHLVSRSYLLQTLIELVPHYMSRWKPRGTHNNDNTFEDNVMELVAAIYSKSFLGIILDFKEVKSWLNTVFNHSRHRKSAKEAYLSMYRAVQCCPRFEEMFLIGSRYKLKENEIINEALFVVLFNAVLTTTRAMTSAIGRFDNVDIVTKHLLVDECEAKLSCGIQMRSLVALRHLENFILEVLRLSPPSPFNFGIARSTFALFSSDGNFQINEGDVLVGNVYEAHRDPEIFSDPHDFDSMRFIDDSLKDYLLTFGGKFTGDARSSNRKCPGQDIGMVVLKVCLLNFIQCNFKLKDKVVFADKNFQRFGRPDNQLVLEEFVFHKPCWWKLTTPSFDTLSQYSYSQYGSKNPSRRSSVSSRSLLLESKLKDESWIRSPSMYRKDYLHQVAHSAQDRDSSISDVDID